MLSGPHGAPVLGRVIHHVHAVQLRLELLGQQPGVRDSVERQLGVVGGTQDSRDSDRHEYAPQRGPTTYGRASTPDVIVDLPPGSVKPIAAGVKERTFEYNPPRNAGANASRHGRALSRPLGSRFTRTRRGFSSVKLPVISNPGDPPTERRLPPWLKRPLPCGRLRRDQAGGRPERRGHRLPGGPLPQSLRVLVEATRHLHDPGGQVHPALPLLRRQHGQARSAGGGRARPAGAGGCGTAIPPRGADGRLPRRSARRGGRSLRRLRSRPSRALPADDGRGAPGRLPCSPRVHRRPLRRRAGVVQPQPGDGRAAHSGDQAAGQVPAFARSAPPGEGDRPAAADQVRADGRAG